MLVKGKKKWLVMIPTTTKNIKVELSEYKGMIIVGVVLFACWQYENVTSSALI